MLSKIRQIAQEAAAADPAHDFSHSERVLANALKIAETEGGDRDVLSAAAYLHDIANYPKNHPKSSLSSERSAEKAESILGDLGFPVAKFPLVRDAILCHSYSRGLTPQTLEGRIFQDADRLDSLGAIGVARTFTVGGALGNPITESIEHFYEKLFKLADRMLTPTGKEIAMERTTMMRNFISALENEMGSTTRHC